MWNLATSCMDRVFAGSAARVRRRRNFVGYNGRSRNCSLLFLLTKFYLFLSLYSAQPIPFHTKIHLKKSLFPQVFLATCEAIHVWQAVAAHTPAPSDSSLPRPSLPRSTPLSSKTATIHHSIDQAPHPPLPLVFVDIRQIIARLNGIGTVNGCAGDGRGEEKSEEERCERLGVGCL